MSMIRCLFAAGALALGACASALSQYPRAAR
jgi:demethoxyubiquinone hydroxylase (CLK1/Coq7/Cat5 family)